MKKVEVRIDINTDPKSIISAFTVGEMLKDWWDVDRALIEKKVDGLYTLAWNIGVNGLGFVSTGIIKEYKPDSLLVIDKFVYLNPDKLFLGPMVLTIQATPTVDGAELYLCQDGYQEGNDWAWYHDAVTKAWPTVVQQLKTYLENKKR